MATTSELGLKVIGTATDPADGTIVRDDLPPLFQAYFGERFGADQIMYHQTVTVDPSRGFGNDNISRQLGFVLLTEGVRVAVQWEVIYQEFPEPAPPTTQTNQHLLEYGAPLVIATADPTLNNSLGTLVVVAPATTADVLVVGFGISR